MCLEKEGIRKDEVSKESGRKHVLTFWSSFQGGHGQGDEQFY